MNTFDGRIGGNDTRQANASASGCDDNFPLFQTDSETL